MRARPVAKALIIPTLAALCLSTACATRPPASQPATPAASPAATAPAPTPAPVPSQSIPSRPIAPVQPVGPAPGTAGGAMTAEQMMAARTAVANGLRAVGERVFFETDSYSLSPEAQAVLRQQATVLRAHPSQQVMIAGNCDERGTREYNLALGARRASAVKDFLISLGVSEEQLDTVSYGKERPIDARPNPEGWAVNRNAHTMILAIS